MPKLSIIVPVYNVKDYFHRCIDTILTQTYKNFELILVDDGSTDGSETMCDEMKAKDSRIAVIHQTNKGQSYARNIGIKMAKGDYIGFVDGDDWVEPRMFEKMIASLEQNDADVVICRLQMDEVFKEKIKVIGYDKEITFNKIEATMEILKDDMIPSFPVNKIYKRTLFEDIEFPVGRIFEDTATIYKLFYKANKVVTIPYIGYHYIQNPNGTCMLKHEDAQKNISRELYNALAFDERYVFAKGIKELEDVVPLCAFKAYQMIRSFIHMLGHKGYSLTEEQESTVDSILSSFDRKDLSWFSTFEKMDLALFHISKHLLKTYLKIVPLFHKMKE